MKWKILLIFFIVICLGASGYALYTSYNLVFSSKKTSSMISKSVSSESSVVSSSVSSASSSLKAADPGALQDLNNKINSYKDSISNIDTEVSLQ